jgi:hypothetical protein
MSSVKGWNGNGNGVGVEFCDVCTCVCVNRYFQQVTGVIDGSGPRVDVRRSRFALVHLGPSLYIASNTE